MQAGSDDGSVFCPKCRVVSWAGGQWEPIGTNPVWVFRELDRLRDKLALSDAVAEKASRICQMAFEKRAVGGCLPAAVLVASALYAACRNTATPRNLKDVGQAANIKRKDIARCYRLLVRELGWDTAVASEPITHVPKIAYDAGVTRKTTLLALEFLSRAGIGVCGQKDAAGIAAAALYLACVKNGEAKTQRDMAEAANVTEVTVRNRYKALKEALKL